MGAKCRKVTCCGLWVQRSNPGCYSLFKQSSGVGYREARLPPINGWQVRDKRLTAYTLLLLFTDQDAGHPNPFEWPDWRAAIRDVLFCNVPATPLSSN